MSLTASAQPTAALRLKLRLFFRRNTIVADVPYHVVDGKRGG
jgi:hypothetical protein